MPGGPDRLFRLNERLLDPSEAQRDTIRAISERYFSRLQETSQRHRAELRAIIDSMQAEIDPLLTPEQRKKLERHRPRFDSERFDPGRRPGGRLRGEQPDMPPVPPPPGE